MQVNGKELRVSIPMFIILGAIIGTVWYLHDQQQIDIDANAEILSDREKAVNKAELLYGEFQEFKKRYNNDRNIDAERYANIIKELNENDMLP